MSGDGGDGFKNRRRNEKMREDSAFKEDEAIFIIFQYGKSSSISDVMRAFRKELYPSQPRKVPSRKIEENCPTNKKTG